MIFTQKKCQIQSQDSFGSSLEHKHFQDLSQLQAAGSFFDFKVLTQLVKMGGSVPRVV